MSRLTAWARANSSAMVLVLVVAALAAANLLYTAHAVTENDRQWCAAMTLLTSRPVPKPADPKANPSRQQTYLYYMTFVELKHSLGC